MMDPTYNGPNEVSYVKPEGVADLLLRMAKLGPVALNTRRSGWSCDVWLGIGTVTDDTPPTVRGYGYHYGPLGAVGTAWAKLKERGLVE